MTSRIDENTLKLFEKYKNNKFSITNSPLVENFLLYTYGLGNVCGDVKFN